MIGAEVYETGHDCRRALKITDQKFAEAKALAEEQMRRLQMGYRQWKDEETTFAREMMVKSLESLTRYSKRGPDPCMG